MVMVELKHRALLIHSVSHIKIHNIKIIASGHISPTCYLISQFLLRAVQFT